MRKLKQGKKARILPLRKQREVKVDHEEVTAVTRSLFSETWNTYVDQASIAAVKLDQSPGIEHVVSNNNEIRLLRIFK